MEIFQFSFDKSIVDFIRLIIMFFKYNKQNNTKQMLPRKAAKLNYSLQNCLSSPQIYKHAF